MSGIGDNGCIMTSSELTGGAGFTYEDAVTASYLVALVCGTTAVGLTPRIIERVSVQQSSFGEPLDDVIIDAIAPSNNSTARLSLQVKRKLIISSANSNTDFRQVIQQCWDTLQNDGFRDGTDRVGAVTGTIAEATFRAFITICEWARASQSANIFMHRFLPDSNASQTHRSVLNAVRDILQDVTGSDPSDDAVHRLFRHLVLIKLDLLHEGATAEAEAIASLQRSLIPDHVGRATELWRQLCGVCQQSCRVH